MSPSHEIDYSRSRHSFQPEPLWVAQMNRLGSDRIPFLFILDFKLQSPLIIPLAEINDECIRFEIKGKSVSTNQTESNQKINLDKQPVAFETYARGFEKVMKAILAGDSYLLNLCYTTKLPEIASLDDIYQTASAPYKVFLKNNFVVFSPESFVSISNGIIRTYPMKGTIDASTPDAENILLADLKEQEEHATVVDLLRNDLSIVSKNVTVERYRYLTKIHTGDKSLLQCSSEISGRLDDEYEKNLGSIFYALLPAGSVTGAPKKKTVELIESIELEPRGFYTGVFGVFDGSAVESAVMIRMIEQRPDGFYYRSGGGITYRSDARSEYQEMMDKVYIPS